jgi:hypothetical protein
MSGVSRHYPNVEKNAAPSGSTVARLRTAADLIAKAAKELEDPAAAAVQVCLALILQRASVATAKLLRCSCGEIFVDRGGHG